MLIQMPQILYTLGSFSSMNMQDDNENILKKVSEKIGELKEQSKKLKQEIKDIKKDLNQK